MLNCVQCKKELDVYDQTVESDYETLYVPSLACNNKECGLYHLIQIGE